MNAATSVSPKKSATVSQISSSAIRTITPTTSHTLIFDFSLLISLTVKTVFNYNAPADKIVYGV